MAFYSITVYGKPIAKARPRFYRRGKFVGTYNTQETEEGRFLLMASGQVDQVIEGPVSVSCTFFLPRPRGHYGTGKNAGVLKTSAPQHHTGKPDVDNMVKFVLDCLNGVAWKDDGQVVKIVGKKVYGEPRTVVDIEGTA